MGTTEVKGLNPIAGDEKTKLEQKINPVQYYVKFSFSITYIFLLTTATITFIEAMRTNSPTVRHVLNLETAISLIGAYFYSVFLEKIATYDKEDKKIDWADITSTRYIDWAMTTPIMLLALSLVLSENISKSITLRVILTIIVLNYIMLYLGYLGETGYIGKLPAMLLGFVAMFGMFYLIFSEYVLFKYHFSNYVIFGIFVSIWIFYGVFYMLSETYKNIGMNILDCLAKCCFGLGLWAYYSKIIVL
jgi:arginine exporter protein ArgO